MNYLELINKCLVELNYKQVSTFAELIKNDHKKLKNILNLINTEVCRLDKWNFLLKKVNLVLPKNTGEIKNTISGRISLVLVDGVRYEFFEDFKKFLTNSQPLNTYSEFNDKLLFPIFDKNKTIEIVYYTGNNAKDSDGNEKTLMLAEEDSSLIPDPYAEPILVYGACMRLKANPQHAKFSYWLSMYKEALANLRSKETVSIDATPMIKLFRD